LGIINNLYFLLIKLWNYESVIEFKNNFKLSIINFLGVINKFLNWWKYVIINFLWDLKVIYNEIWFITYNTTNNLELSMDKIYH